MTKSYVPFIPVLLMIITSCGGSGGSTPAPDPTPVVGNCYDGTVNNIVGVEDPFYSNAWHLKNTGPTKAVSAFSNYSAVAGIDANVENVHKAGKGCTGKGITIAIVDSGMEIGHEDLRDNVLLGKSWNFDYNTNDPSPALNQLEFDHGTAVAGIAGARGWNDKGSRGIAPFASLVAYSNNTKISSQAATNMAYLAFGASALADKKQSVTASFGDRADTTSIFNFSRGTDYAGPTDVVDDDTSEAAAKYGTEKLRNRLGAIYFQSAGNEFVDMAGAYLPDSTKMDVNCPKILGDDAALLGGTLSNLAGMSCGNSNHEPTKKPYFYQVAAMHNTGYASSYSSAGAANWITGFGGENGTDDPAIITTDNSGCTSGANNTDNKNNWLKKYGAKIIKLLADLFGDPSSKDTACNYTGTMNGTSSAAPSVSGVAALMLEANPKLTWRDVGYILAKTARKVDPKISSGANAVTFTPTDGSSPWNLDEPWITNLAGFNFQNRYGFGLVDADKAVKLAVKYTAPAGRRSTELTAVGSASTTSQTQLAGVYSSTVTFADATAITGPLRLDLTLTNKTGEAINMGFLQFEVLNTKTKTKSILLPAFTSWYVGGKDDKYKLKDQAQQKFRFQTNAFFGEAVAGTYEIKVIDFSGASGAPGKTLDFKPTLTSYSI